MDGKNRDPLRGTEEEGEGRREDGGGPRSSGPQAVQAGTFPRPGSHLIAPLARWPSHGPQAPRGAGGPPRGFCQELELRCREGGWGPWQPRQGRAWVALSLHRSHCLCATAAQLRMTRRFSQRVTWKEMGRQIHFPGRLQYPHRI